MLTCTGCSAVIERVSNVLTRSETVPHWAKTGFRLVWHTHILKVHTASRPTFTASCYHTSITTTACLIWPNRGGSNCCQQSFPTTVTRPRFSITFFHVPAASSFFQLCQCTDLIDCSSRHPPGINTDRVSSDCPWLFSPLLVTPALFSLVSRVSNHTPAATKAAFSPPRTYGLRAADDVHGFELRLLTNGDFCVRGWGVKSVYPYRSCGGLCPGSQFESGFRYLLKYP